MKETDINGPAESNFDPELDPHAERRRKLMQFGVATAAAAPMLLAAMTAEKAIAQTGPLPP